MTTFIEKCEKLVKEENLLIILEKLNKLNQQKLNESNISHFVNAMYELSDDVRTVVAFNSFKQNLDFSVQNKYNKDLISEIESSLLNVVFKFKSFANGKIDKLNIDFKKEIKDQLMYLEQTTLALTRENHYLEKKANAEKLFDTYQISISNKKIDINDNLIPLDELRFSSNEYAKIILDEESRMIVQAISILKGIFDYKYNKAKELYPLSENPLLELSAKSNYINEKVVYSLQNAIKENKKIRKDVVQFLGSFKKNEQYFKNEQLRIIEQTSSSLSFTFEEAISIIKKGFSKVDKEFSDFVDYLLDNDLIEHSVSENKRTGAYASYLPSLKQTIVFVQFTGTIQDVITLAHEIGHAYHHRMLSDKPKDLAEYPLIFAESVSMFSEALIIEELENYCGEESKKELELQKIIKIFDLLVMVPSRFDVEDMLIKKYEKGLFNKEDITIDYQKIIKNWYGESNSIEDPYYWMKVRHFFFVNQNFYNYPYYFAFIFNYKLLKDRNNKGFFEKYKEFLKDSASRNAISCLKKHFGYSIEDKYFWTEIIKEIEKDLMKAIN